MITWAHLQEQLEVVTWLFSIDLSNTTCKKKHHTHPTSCWTTLIYTLFDQRTKYIVASKDTRGILSWLEWGTRARTTYVITPPKITVQVTSEVETTSKCTQIKELQLRYKAQWYGTCIPVYISVHMGSAIAYGILDEMSVQPARILYWITHHWWQVPQNIRCIKTPISSCRVLEIAWRMAHHWLCSSMKSIHVGKRSCPPRTLPPQVFKAS